MQRLRRPVQVIVVSSVMLTFISYWRTAAIVLCDLASTAYYIGGIVEGAIGPAAPWFILAVMLFSYAVRSIYIESCSLFVRGGVYRVVKEAMGGFLAKLSVSALMFDYILTGPISGMSAGQYIMGLLLDTVATVNPAMKLSATATGPVRNWGAVIIACAITLYFFRQNVIGIHESSGKALKIMAATTVMAVVMLVWCGATLLVHGPVNRVPLKPDLTLKVEYQAVPGVDRVTGERREIWQRDSDGRLVPKMENGLPVPKLNEATGRPEDPLGFLGRMSPSLAEKLRRPGNWLSLIGLVGVLLAFGHSILAMSGEETLAQVYREVESPKLPNFKKAAFIVFVYSVVLTASVCFLAVLLIPDEVRMKDYSNNLIGGLAMHVIGPPLARLLLNAFVVVVGFLILAGAVNTAIIGSNGVLNRVAEDGVLPDWFLRPHRRFGTTHRVLYLIVGLQLLTILLSRGNMYVLGEAYAFGVVWSFVFKALAMVVLRFKDRSPREFKVPVNIHVGNVEVPIGLTAIFLILLVTAALNFLTKEVATISGTAFTLVFLTIFMTSEYIHEKKRGAAAHQHLEQFNETHGRRDLAGFARPDEALSEAGGHPLSAEPFHAGKVPGGNRPGNHRGRRPDGQVDSAGRRIAPRAAIRSLRSAVDDRRGHAGGEGGQGGHALDPADQQPPVRHRQHRQHAASAGTRPGGFQPILARRATGADRLLLDQRASRRPGAVDGADPQPQPRRFARPGRGQSHPQDQRAPGPLRRRVAVRRRRRQPCHAGPPRYPGRQRLVQCRADDA